MVKTVNYGLPLKKEKAEREKSLLQTQLLCKIKINSGAVNQTESHASCKKGSVQTRFCLELSWHKHRTRES